MCALHKVRDKVQHVALPETLSITISMGLGLINIRLLQLFYFAR